MLKLITSTILFSAILLLAAFQNKPTAITLDAATSVAKVLEDLGAPSPKHTVDADVEGVSMEVGKNIVLNGFSVNSFGNYTNRQSKHFVCTSCHNVVKEDPDLRYADPEARLDYVAKNGLPFLQGTTLYGVVNRETFYNGDYVKKYGDLVEPARNSLRGAIQLCATECAQGRALEDWEIESVLAYLWTIDLKMDDLEVSNTDQDQIERAMNSGDQKANAIETLKSYYLNYSPATFLTPPNNRNEGYPLEGNADRGKLVYDLSCMHCHGEQRYSLFNLDDSKHNFEFLEKHFPQYTRYSTYQVARYGTSPSNGKRAYMPHYPKERMSNQQMEDLRAYVKEQSGKGM